MPTENINQPLPPHQQPATPVNEAALEFIRKNTPIEEQVASQQPIAQENEIVDRRYEEFGRVVSAQVEERPVTVIVFISWLFHIITFTYTTLTLLLFGTIIALAIALTNAGTPGFLYLKYYPNVGLLPVFSCAAMLVFFYIAVKIKEGSRLSWLLGVISLITLPVSFFYIMPVMSYPLVKLVAVYAGSSEKPLFSPSITVATLAHYFSFFLAFEAILIILIIFLKHFRYEPKAISSNAKTALIVLFILLFIPISSVVGYGYYSAQDTDFGYSDASSSVSYHIYYPQEEENSRVNATKFIMNEELADLYNAILVSYDIPLPTRIKTGTSSLIVMKQVRVKPDFALERFVSRQDRNFDSLVEAISVQTAKNNQGFLIQKGPFTTLWFLMSDDVLIQLTSQFVGKEELTEFASLLH